MKTGYVPSTRRDKRQAQALRHILCHVRADPAAVGPQHPLPEPLAPLATGLATAVEPEPALREQIHAEQPTEGVRRIRELAGVRRLAQQPSRATCHVHTGERG